MLCYTSTAKPDVMLYKLSQARCYVIQVQPSPMLCYTNKAKPDVMLYK